ncbi:MAG: AAA family ATPase, partial [Synechococcus sp. SB0664_bin_36]|nr:AAA family ATPase [Synechococcus sp. SB0664_bin_36]
MSITMLIGSAEPYSGKSALVLGVAQWLKSQGISFRYSKPLATSLERQRQPSDRLFDDDAHLIGDMLQLAPTDLIPSLAASASTGHLDFAQLVPGMEREYVAGLQNGMAAGPA